MTYSNRSNYLHYRLLKQETNNAIDVVSDKKSEIGSTSSKNKSNTSKLDDLDDSKLLSPFAIV